MTNESTTLPTEWVHVESSAMNRYRWENITDDTATFHLPNFRKGGKFRQGYLFTVPIESAREFERARARGESVGTSLAVHVRKMATLTVRVADGSEVE